MFVLKQRISKALRRAPSLHRLLKRNPRGGDIFRAGIQNEALFGAEVCAISNSQLGRLRHEAVRASGFIPRQAAPALKAIALGSLRDPVADYMCRTLEQWAREVCTLRTGFPAKPGDLLSAQEMARLHEKRHELAHFGSPYIPAAIQTNMS